MTLIPPDRLFQLNSLVPTGFPYALRGNLLAKQDDPFQIPFTGLEPNFIYDLYINNTRNRAFTSDNEGELLVTVDLEAGRDYELRLFPLGGTEFGQKRIWVSVRNWATFHSVSSEMILQEDANIATIYDGLNIDTSAIEELNNYHGRNIFQGNSSSYGIQAFRETLRILRNAYLNEGGSIDGIRDAIASHSFINPLIFSGRQLPIWWLDQELSDEFRFRTRLMSNDLDSLNGSALRGLGSLSGSSSNFGILNVNLTEPDNLRIEFDSSWDGGDILITGTTRFGVDVQEVITSSPGNVIESIYNYQSVQSIYKTLVGSAGSVYFGYVNVKFVKVTEISPFVIADQTNTLEYRPAATPGREQFRLKGEISLEQSNSLTGIKNYRVYPPRLEADLMSSEVEPFNLGSNGRYFSFEIDGRGRVDIDFEDYVPGTIIDILSVSASDIVDIINQELTSRPSYGATYASSAVVVSTNAGNSFKIVGNVNAQSIIDFNGRDLGSFIKIYGTDNVNDFSNRVFAIEELEENESRLFFGTRSERWFDIEVNYDFRPSATVNDTFEFLGPTLPDNFFAQGLNVIDFRRTSYSAKQALICEVTGNSPSFERRYPRILERKGRVITLQMVVSIGNSTLTTNSPFQFFMSFDGGTNYYSFNTVVDLQPDAVPIGITNYEIGGYHQTFTAKAYIPIDAESAILRVQGSGFTIGDILVIDDLSVFDLNQTSKYLATNTVTRGPSYNFLRSQIHYWFPEQSQNTELRDVGLLDEEGHLQRLKPSNVVIDKINSTELNFSRTRPSETVPGNNPTALLPFSQWSPTLDLGDYIEFQVLDSNEGSLITLVFEERPPILDNLGRFIEWGPGNIPGSLPIPYSRNETLPGRPGTPLPGDFLPIKASTYGRVDVAIDDERLRRTEEGLPQLVASSFSNANGRITITQDFYGVNGNTEITGSIVDNSTFVDSSFNDGTDSIPGPLIGESTLPLTTAINVVGAWSAEQLDASTRTNLEVVVNSPRKASFVVPTNISNISTLDDPILGEFVEVLNEANSNSELAGFINDNLVSVLPPVANGSSELTGEIVIEPLVLGFIEGTASGNSQLEGEIDDLLVSVIIPPSASIVLTSATPIHVNDTAAFNVTAPTGSGPMTWQVTSTTFGVVDSGTFANAGDFDVVTSPVLDYPTRIENFELEVTNSAGTTTSDIDVTVEESMDLIPNGAFSLIPNGDTLPIPITLPTGNDRGLFVLLTYDGTTPIPSHAQLGTTIVGHQCRSTITSSSLPDSERQCVLYYFSESDLSAGTTNNQLTFSDFLTVYNFPGDWAVHLYTATNVGVVTPNAGILGGTGSTLTTSILSMTEYSRCLSLSVAVGSVHTATANFIGTDGSTSGGTGEIRSFEGIPDSSGNLQIAYTDNDPTDPRIGYCYVIVDPV